MTLSTPIELENDNTNKKHYHRKVKIERLFSSVKQSTHFIDENWCYPFEVIEGDANSRTRLYISRNRDDSVISHGLVSGML